MKAGIFLASLILSAFSPYRPTYLLSSTTYTPLVPNTVWRWANDSFIVFLEPNVVLSIHQGFNNFFITEGCLNESVRTFGKNIRYLTKCKLLNIWYTKGHMCHISSMKMFIYNCPKSIFKLCVNSLKGNISNGSRLISLYQNFWLLGKPVICWTLWRLIHIIFLKRVTTDSYSKCVHL